MGTGEMWTWGHWWVGWGIATETFGLMGLCMVVVVGGGG